MVVYIDKKITMNPIPTATVIMADIKAFNAGRSFEVIRDIYSFVEWIWCVGRSCLMEVMTDWV
jgi:hypothetical protein